VTTTGARVAVLGCGDWGKNLVRNFHALGALAAVADVSPHGRQAAARIAPGVAIHDRLDAALDDRSIAGVVIATPAETHAELTERALLAGKDVLCEKPLALHYDAARRVHDLAVRRGRVLMVGHLLEYHPAIQELRARVAGGQLGQIRYLYSNRTNLGKVRREENILWSFAPHDLAVILRLVGALPCQVIAGNDHQVTILPRLPGSRNWCSRACSSATTRSPQPPTACWQRMWKWRPTSARPLSGSDPKRASMTERRCWRRTWSIPSRP